MGLALDESGGDEPVYQPARVVPVFADQQFPEPGEGEGLVVAEHPQYLTLGRGEADRPETGGENTIPFALDRQDQVAKFLSRSDACLHSPASDAVGWRRADRVRPG